VKEKHTYRSVAAALREDIRSGVYPDGTLLPIENDLRIRFGVSRSTVRRALSTLAETGWAEIKPNRGVAARQGPLTELNGSVAYIDYGELINERVFFGISRALHGTGMHLTHIDSKLYTDEGALEYAAENGFLAAFIWSKEGFPDTCRVAAVQKRLPIIALDHRFGSVRTDLVSEDNLEGAARVVRHLARLGRTRIAVTGMMDMLEVNHERFSGYLKGLFQSGLTPHPIDFAFSLTSGEGPPETEHLVQRLRNENRPDALFVLQDMCVPAVVEAVFSAGLRVPEDVAIAAFGGEVPIQIDGVGLTSMVVDWKSFAEQCVSVLHQRLNAPSQPPVQVSLPTSLIVRGSCGAPFETWDALPNAGVDVHLGPRWKVQQDYLQIRFETARHMPT
jgi:LacI family transcriptional regulator